MLEDEGARRRAAARRRRTRSSRSCRSKQIAALRFASDEEFGALLERAARENLSPKDIKAVDQDLASGPASHVTKAAPVTPDEQQEVRRLIDAHEHTLQVCRACAETTRDLAWEVKRGSMPSAESLAATLAEVERVLDDLGKVEVAIAEMKAALW